ncbi:MAG: NUDIX domain-containing protein [Pseudomonadota bacterium]
MTSLFFFGSLRDQELLEIVLGRVVDPGDLRPATAPGFATRTLADEAYPHLSASRDAVAEGVLATGLSAADIHRLKYFEEDEYDLAPLVVQTAVGAEDAHYFRTTGKAPESNGLWDYGKWVRDEREVALAAAEELMAHIDIVPVGDIDSIWPGVMIRARMRARARTAAVVPDTIRHGWTREDVESLAIDRPYTQFFAVEEHRLRHRLNDGGWSAPIDRTVFTSGDAVTVLPYDPATGHVLLIEQFRAAAYARGDHNPWSIEVIAGRIDHELDPEVCARREAREEAGLDLDRIEQVAAYYSAPGFAAEHITSYVAAADLSGQGGVFGLAVENEDIRAFTVPLEDALAAIGTGEINNGPAILSLLWLQGNAARLKTG